MAIRIAVCDDDVMAVGAIRGAVEKVLNEQGLAVEISEYYAVKTLRSALQQQSFDLLLLDIDMPGISGIEFGRMLRREKMIRTSSLFPTVRIVCLRRCRSFPADSSAKVIFLQICRAMLGFLQIASRQNRRQPVSCWTMARMLSPCLFIR